MVNPIPQGYQSVTPYLVLKDCSAAIEFYKRAFDAKETFRMPMPDGKVAHAELRINGAMVMMADANDDYPPTSSVLMFYVTDCDAVFQRAVEHGAKVDRPLKTQFYGDRSGTLRDPFGQLWTISTHVEDVPPEELERRMKNG